MDDAPKRESRWVLPSDGANIIPLARASAYVATPTHEAVAMRRTARVRLSSRDDAAAFDVARSSKRSRSSDMTNARRVVRRLCSVVDAARERLFKLTNQRVYSPALRFFPATAVASL